MRFIHAADIHLDSPLNGLDAYEDSPADRLRAATRQAFEKLVQCAVNERVDFVIIAGDLYDGQWKDHNTGLFFVKQMNELKRADIPVYILYGNHDAESELTKALKLPDNVFVFEAKSAKTFQLERHKVALHGQSFPIPKVVNNLVPGYPDPIPGWLNIGVLHTALEGNAAHSRYAPCSVSELEAKGYQYWALGHVHESWIKHGDVVIAYPGNLQGRHIGECGPRGALLVTASGANIEKVERIQLDVLRWHELDVNLEDTLSLDDVLTRIGEHFNRLIIESDEEIPYAVRVVLRGSTPVHGELLNRESHLRSEVISQILTADASRLWLEKVKIRTQAPRLEKAETDDELVTGFRSTIEQTVVSLKDTDPLFTNLLDEFHQIISKVPAEVFVSNTDLKEIRDDRALAVRNYLMQAVDLLGSKLK